MGLLDRVARLVRANLNDLVDRAEDPRKILKQVILDMENQLMQVKTQVAISVAHQHLLAKKLQENREAEAAWLRKAGVSASKGNDDLARAGIERALSHRQTAVGFEQQLQDQKLQVDHLKSALSRLEAKLGEARTRSELLIAQQRRARALGKATEAKVALLEGDRGNDFRRMSDRILMEEALSTAKAELASGDVDEKLIALERDDQIEQILRDLKSRAT